nr:hypothetical protein [Micromonospora sp. DSM 115978]
AVSTGGGPNGCGTDEHFAEQMTAALDKISRAVERCVAYVKMFALFVPGLGVDRISASSATYSTPVSSLTHRKCANDTGLVPDPPVGAARSGLKMVLVAR